MGWEFDDFPDILEGFESKRFHKIFTTVSVIGAVFLFILCILIIGHLTNKQNETLSFSHNNATIMVEDYKQFDEIVMSQVSEKYDNVIKLYDSSRLSLDTIENRNGSVIVERCICYVDTYNDGDGSATILNAFDEDYSYMHYSGLSEEINIGTIVVSYFVYNPDTNYIDDTTDIYDFVLTREFEVSKVE